MLDKIGHIKNPLTVIAVFAALAEVSGTVMLPTMEENVQTIFVWYVMGFPIGLVCLFFFVLYKKHYVLYAPSDFRKDESFRELFVHASVGRKIEQLTTAENEDALVNPDTVPSDEAPAAQPQRAAPTIASIYLAEELVIDRISKSRNIVFDRNVALAGNRSVEFDATAKTEAGYVFVEVKYVSRLSSASRFEGIYRRVDLFANNYLNVPPAPETVEIIFALIKAPELDDEAFKKIKSKIEGISAKYRFKTTIEVFEKSALEAIN